MFVRILDVDKRMYISVERMLLLVKGYCKSGVMNLESLRFWNTLFRKIIRNLSFSGTEKVEFVDIYKRIRET